MAKNSSIEWTHHTHNLWWGCTKVGKGCEHCYAERDSKRFHKEDIWGPEAGRRFFLPKHYEQPIKWNKAAVKADERHRVFCMSMGDLFERHLDDEIARCMLTERIVLWDLIETKTHNLDWLLLTKRLDNVLKMVPHKWHRRWPSNAWLGFSASNQNEYTEGLFQLYYVLEGLRQKPPVCFVSLEPLLGPIDLAPIKQCPGCGVLMTPDDLFYTEGDCINVGDSCKWHYPLDDWLPLDWVIAGGESSRQARPTHPDWVRGIRDRCIEVGVPFFFKQWGEWLPADQYLDAKIELGYYDLSKDKMLAATKETPGFLRVGKKRAGDILDGQTWQQFPSVTP